jgi:hypothetical protein
VQGGATVILCANQTFLTRRTRILWENSDDDLNFKGLNLASC